MRTINKIYKNYIIHPAKVRIQLKKLGYKIGHWWNNGRITGLADFGGGNLEVKEIIISDRYSIEKISDNIYKHNWYKDISVEVCIWNNNTLYPSIDREKLRNDLIRLGYNPEVKEDKIILK